MVRPSHFCVNPETADNAFQVTRTPASHALRLAAAAEHDQVVATLRDAGVQVHVVEDTDAVTPDSTFVNNWISTHPDGTIAVYPMSSPARRRERRSDIVDWLRRTYRVTRVLDYTAAERECAFFEGTGALVIDHQTGTGFVGLSHRADRGLARRVCADLGLDPVLVETADRHGRPIYHTNVWLSVGSGFVVWCPEVVDADARDRLRRRFAETGRDVVDITADQMARFAGNVLEVSSLTGPVLAMSQAAFEAYTVEQRDVLSRHARIVAVGMPTLELSGGSMRCLLAGLHLRRR